MVTLEEKLALFAEAGIDWCILGDFRELRDYSPERFAREVLVEGCDCRHIICGFNFSFGARGQGSADTLHALFPGHCSVVDPVCLGETTVSSTAIRAAIAEGNMERASAMLGRPGRFACRFFTVRRWDAPSAFPRSINVSRKGCPPGFGVYAALCEIDGVRYPAVTNVGIRPSVDDGENVTCESHVIGLRADLYGCPVRIHFFTHLRPEQKFDSLDALKAAISRDITAARAYFGAR